MTKTRTILYKSSTAIQTSVNLQEKIILIRNSRMYVKRVIIGSFLRNKFRKYTICICFNPLKKTSIFKKSLNKTLHLVKAFYFV